MHSGTHHSLLLMLLLPAASACTPEEALSSSHPGTGDPCCEACHQLDDHNQGLDPHECASCHGSNGAPPGHGEEGPCTDCHGETHSCASSPDPQSCQTCHASGP